MNLALVVPALLLGIRYLPKTWPAERPGRFDLLGSLILLVLLTGLAMLLIPATGGMDVRAVVAAGLALAVLTAVFVWRELVHTRTPWCS